MKKRCNQCNQIKDLDEFYCDKRYADGHINICKQCFKAYNQKQYRSRGKQYWQRYYSQHKNKQQLVEYSQLLQKLDQILDKLNKL